MDERVYLFVRNEEQHVIQSTGSGVDVVPIGDFPNPRPRIAQEVANRTGSLGIELGSDVTQVGGERKLYVHVQDTSLGEQECEVRSAAASLKLGVLPVLNPLDKTG